MIAASLTGPPRFDELQENLKPPTTLAAAENMVRFEIAFQTQDRRPLAKCRRQRVLELATVRNTERAR